jgi:hypothetical protein
MIEHLHRLAAHAYYCGEHDVGRRACERLMRMDLSPEKDETVRSNRTWYTRPLGDLVDVWFTPLEPAVRVGWSRFNPSVVIHDGVPLYNVRTSNYRIDDNGQYVMPPEDAGVIRTDNLLYERPGLATMLQCDYPRSQFPVDGLEDVRLNSIDGRLYASATLRNLDGQDGTCRMAYGEVVDGRIAGLVCHDTLDGKHEKNWMPLVGQKRWLYSCSANGHVCLVEDAGDDWTVTAYAESPPVARAFRGGSQLVPIGGGEWLAVIHEVAMVKGRRVYEHRFVLFSEDDWSIAAVSPPFAFRESRAIEFCAGLALRGGKLIATFGVRDAEAWMAEMAVEQVRSILESPTWE